MYRSALRASPLRAIRPTAQLVSSSAARRFASTSLDKNRGTWKGTGLRWGLAVAAVYFYNTSPIFSDEIPQPESAPAQFSDSDLPTIDALIEEKRRHAAASTRPPPPPPTTESTSNAVEADIEKVAQEESDRGASTTDGAPAAALAAVPEPGSPEALEQEASQQGAFNPETGEINWDCPCLGGMADGPCGEEFKAAFSCFVYSKDEPKGMDCIDKFQHMQDCFRKFPEIYGSELGDDEDAGAASPEGAEGAEVAKPSENEAPVEKEEVKKSTKEKVKKSTAEKVKKSTTEEPIPNEAFDATDANKSKKE